MQPNEAPEAPKPPALHVLRGVNVDPTNPAPGAHPQMSYWHSHNFNSIRLVCKPGGQAENYAAAAVKAGLYVLGQVTSESKGQLLYNCHAYVLRNEIDISSPASEGVIPEDKYAQEVLTYCGQYPDLKFILGSVAAGDYQAGYLTGVLQVLHSAGFPANIIGFAIHPYAKGLHDARNLINAHVQAAQGVVGRLLPAYVDEWNRPVSEIPGFDWYLRSDPNVAGGWYFCADDDMVSGFGLATHGKPKPELSQFRAFNANPTPAPTAYAPTVTTDWTSPWDNGAYPSTPLGWLIHGSRSGVPSMTTDEEFWATAHFTHTRQDGLAYQATIGDDIVSIGLPDGHWGWHARACSYKYVGYELAQSVEAHPISDAQVRALVWRMVQDRKVWPDLPLVLKTHAEVDGTAEYGNYYDGKTDVFSRGAATWDELRGRILAECGRQGVH